MKIVINNRTHWINYHHLYCFYVVATEGSLLAASKSLGIGQSALSIQMKQFEESLGFSLFVRAHKKLELNEQGKIVHAYAKEIFRLGTEMIAAVNDRPTATRTHLQIGTLDTIPKHLTVKLANEAILKKSCSVTLIEGKSEELFESLLSYKLDLVITNIMPETEPGKVFARSIAKLPLWVVGARKFLKLKDGFPMSLNHQPFIVPTGDSHVRHAFDHFCKLNEVKTDYVAETQDVMVQKLMAISQVGLTVIPEFAVREYLEKKELFFIGRLQGVFEELFMVSASRKIENPAAAYLMRHFEVI